MSKKKVEKISDLSFDQKNINKGSEYGNALLEKSMREVGAGRSILIDKNNNIIAGNQTAQKASEIGIEDIIVVETDGTKLVAVKRTDLDINSKLGIKAKILDNTVSKHNYVEDADVKDALCEEYNLDGNELGLQMTTYLDEEEEKQDLSDKIKTEFKIEVVCKNEAHQEKVYNQLIELGYECRILTL